MKAEKFFIDGAKRSYEVEKFLRDELDAAGFSHAEVKKTPLGTRVVIYALRPGLVIGGGGENVKKLTSTLSSKFGIENPNLEVEQVRDQYLDPHIVAWKIARSLERGGYFKRIVNLMLERIMAAGAKGVELRLSGKLPSARAKTWIFVEGKLRKCGQEAIDQTRIAYATSLPKTGTIGVKVSILPPDAEFSDSIERRVQASEPVEEKPRETKPVEKEAVKEEVETEEKTEEQPTTKQEEVKENNEAEKTTEKKE